VFGIVTQNEGHILVHSELGQGTTFEVYLPRSEEALVRAAADSAETVPEHGVETVLVVEDEADVRTLTANALTMHGYRVLSASNGVEALQVSEMHDGPIHLLLTDVVMPQLGGMELVEQLQPQRPEMRVLYMSGYADRPLVRRFLSDPNVAFLPKPFNADMLAQKVRSVLEDGSPLDLPG
jgi:DNA-binding NtrC family response regulator